MAGTFRPGVTAQILLDASKSVTSGKPMLLVDGGVENFNSAVDKVVETGLLKRVLAQTEITFSNSLAGISTFAGRRMAVRGVGIASARNKLVSSRPQQ